MAEVQWQCPAAGAPRTGAHSAALSHRMLLLLLTCASPCASAAATAGPHLLPAGSGLPPQHPAPAAASVDHEPPAVEHSRRPPPRSPSTPSAFLQRCEPPVVPADAGTVPVVIRGTGFAEPAAGLSLTCHIRGGLFHGAYTPDPVPSPANNTVATWLNSTAVRCMVPGSGITFDGHLDIKLDGDEGYSNPQAHNASSLPPLRSTQFVQAAFGRRPYLSNETASAEMILLPDAEAIAEFPPTRTAAVLKVCHAVVNLVGGAADLRGPGHDMHGVGGPLPPSGCAEVPLPRNGAAAAVPVKVELGSATAADFNVSIDISLLSSSGGAPLLRLATKYRRLMVAPASQLQTPGGGGGSFVAVDHRRRALRANGELLVTQGYYFYGFVMTWRGNSTLQCALDDLTVLAQQGGE